MSQWVIWWMVGGGVVALAALLLIWILAMAWSIEKHAGRALRALRRIEQNTGAIWNLAGVSNRLSHIVDHADAIERRTAAAASGSQSGAERQP